MDHAPPPSPSPVDAAVADLFHYAIDREDVKWLLARLHPEAQVQRTTVEYELQLLIQCHQQIEIDVSYIHGADILDSKNRFDK